MQSKIDELVLKAQKGDGHAFGQIYDELVKPIYRYIYYRVEPAIAEDLTEDTFLKVWENLRKYKKGKFPFSAWVFRIAHNLVCDYYRKHRSAVAEMDENTADPILSNNPAFQVNVRFNEIRLRKAILKLPEAYQQVIVLKYINDLPNSDISATLGKPEGTVRTIQFRALRQLRSLLEEKREDF
ncbi:MAG: sigma-70 family RNA polymerase sigma factor [Candidatus Peregrinibacteria bacterium]